jgi:hypothetical protein
MSSSEQPPTPQVHCDCQSSFLIAQSLQADVEGHSFQCCEKIHVGTSFEKCTASELGPNSNVHAPLGRARLQPCRSGPRTTWALAPEVPTPNA